MLFCLFPLNCRAAVTVTLPVLYVQDDGATCRCAHKCTHICFIWFNIPIFYETLQCAENIFNANGCVSPYSSNMYLLHRTAVLFNFVHHVVFQEEHNISESGSVNKFQASHSNIAEDSGHSLHDTVLDCLTLKIRAL